MQKNLVAVDEVIVEKVGSVGHVRLNREKAINSLTLPMVCAIRSALEDFAIDEDVISVVLTGEGDRGFCAGGDVVDLYKYGRSTEVDATQFWREEYPLNYRISTYPKPYISFMDGIVMGGGVGLSAHGSYRVVTERIKLAMPETAIGYFPDVGITWLLPKAPGKIGTWLGLTGHAVNADDAIYLGLADYYVTTDQLGALFDALTHATKANEIAGVIGAFSSLPLAGKLKVNQHVIDTTMSYDRVEDIVAALIKDGGSFAKETLDVMKLRSPTSLKLALKMIRDGANSLNLMECLEREYDAGVVMLSKHDFYEGVRAALIDKDRNPMWFPATLEEVGDDIISEYFPSDRTNLFLR